MRRTPERTPSRTRTPLPAAALLTLHLAAATDAAPPEIDAIELRALRPGVASVLVLKGRQLADVREVRTSWTGRLSRRDAEGWEATAGTLKFPVYVPREVPAGIEWIRLAGTNGVSDAALLLIDPLPTAVRPATGDPGHLPAPPVAVDAFVKEAQTDRWQVPLKAGERTAFEVVALRVGSPLDPEMRVFDPTGREVARAGGIPGLGGDAACELVPERTGTYRVEIRDAEHGGGTGHRYRLRIGNFLLAPVPELGQSGLAGRLPERLSWTSGVGVGRGQGAWVRGAEEPAARWDAWARWSVETPGLAGAASITPRWMLSDRAATREREPNGDALHALPWAPGTTVAGAFDAPEDQDWYRLEVATAGTREFTARSRGVGWACDVMLRVCDAGGKTLTTGPVGESDAHVRHRFETPGTYYLVAEEVAGRHGPGRAYLLDEDPSAPGFEVSSELDRVHVPSGGHQSFPIQIERRGHDGPIRLEADGLPPGVTLEKAVVEARKKEWNLEFRCAADVPPGTWERFVLRVLPEPGEASRSTRIEVRRALRKTFPRMLSWPPGMTRELWIGVVPPSP